MTAASLRLALAAVAAMLMAPALAAAHVEVGRGGNGDVVVTVANESAGADTTEVSVRLPDNVIQAEFPKIAGWRGSGATEPVSPPLAIAGTTVTRRVATVTWTGGRIRPGQTAAFRLRVRVRQGTKRAGLAFPTVQRFSDGSVVRWIGPEGSENPAGVLAAALPVVAVAPVPVESGTTTGTQPETGAATTASPGDSGDFPLALVLGIAAAVVLAGGAIGVILARRRRAG